MPCSVNSPAAALPACWRCLCEELPLPLPDRIVPMPLPPGLCRRHLWRRPEFDDLLLRFLLTLLHRAEPIVIEDAHGLDHVAGRHRPVLDKDEILAVLEIGRLREVVRTKID